MAKPLSVSAWNFTKDITISLSIMRETQGSIERSFVWFNVDYLQIGVGDTTWGAQVHP